MTTSAQWQMQIEALLDARGMKTGSDQAQAAVKDLESQVDRSTDDINQSLRTMDGGVSSTLGSGGTLDRSASEAESSIGRVKDQVGEELPGAFLDMQNGAASAAQGLAAAFATAGPVGIALAGVLALFSAIKTKSDATAQVMRDQINGALSQIEVKARQSNKAIQEAYEKTLTFQSTVSEIGGGDETKGFGILKRNAEDMGVSVSDIVNLLNGDMTKGSLRLRDLLRQQKDAQREQVDIMGDGAHRVLPQLSAGWAFLDQQLQIVNEKHRTAVEILKANRDVLRESAAATKDMAGWMSATEVRAQGVANKLSAAQKFYGGLPQ